MLFLFIVLFAVVDHNKLDRPVCHSLLSAVLRVLQLVDLDAPALMALKQQLQQQRPGVDILAMAANVCDNKAMARVVKEHMSRCVILQMQCVVLSLEIVLQHSYNLAGTAVLQPNVDKWLTATSHFPAGVVSAVFFKGICICCWESNQHTTASCRLLSAEDSGHGLSCLGCRPVNMMPSQTTHATGYSCCCLLMLVAGHVPSCIECWHWQAW